MAKITQKIKKFIREGGEKRMRKILVLSICAAFMVIGARSAYALIPIMWDVSKAGAPAHGDADSRTWVFDEFGIKAQTTTIQYDSDGSGTLTVGDAFTDIGDLRVTDLLAAGVIDKEGLNDLFGYEVTGIWDDLGGTVTGLSVVGTDTRIDIQYTSGTIDFYLDTPPDSLFANPAGTSPPAGAGGTGFGPDASATLIAQGTVTQGIGHTFIDFGGGELENQGSIELMIDLTYLLPGFWLDSSGNDLLNNSIQWIFAFTDMNINTPTLVQGTPAGALYTAYSNEDGSGHIEIIPEPTSLLLLGGGLLGFVGIGLRKRRSA